MTNWNIKPAEKINGTVTPPPDKSITHRAIMLAALSEGESVISNYLAAEDCLSTLNAFISMGIKVEKSTESLHIYGGGIKGLRQPENVIDAGNSGTTVRLLSGILAGQNLSAKITGDASLSRRPMKRIIEPLRRMGAVIHARDDNYLPLEITGNTKLSPIHYSLPVPSAQVKSSVLLAAIQCSGITSVAEPVKSRDHTERMLASRGADIKVNGLTVSVKGPCALRPQDMSVPGDISSAAFFLASAALARSSDVTVQNIGINPTRDGILEIMKQMGVDFSNIKSANVSGEPVADIRVRSSRLGSAVITGEIIPRLVDEVPVIVLMATQARGTTVIAGAGELRVKESDRLSTITLELGKMGACIRENEDGLIIEGPTPLHGAEVESHGDHRIAMTLAVAGLIASGETIVKDIDCVNTSFPGFIEQLQKLI